MEQMQHNADSSRVWTDHPFSKPGWGRRLHRVWWEMSDKLPVRCLYVWRPLCATILGGHLPEKGRTGKTWCSLCYCMLHIDGSIEPPGHTIEARNDGEADG